MPRKGIFEKRWKLSDPEAKEILAMRYIRSKLKSRFSGLKLKIQYIIQPFWFQKYQLCPFWTMNVEVYLVNLLMILSDVLFCKEGSICKEFFLEESLRYLFFFIFVFLIKNSEMFQWIGDFCQMTLKKHELRYLFFLTFVFLKRYSKQWSYQSKRLLNVKNMPFQ